MKLKQTCQIVVIGVLVAFLSTCKSRSEATSKVQDYFSLEDGVYYWTYFAANHEDVLCDARCAKGFDPISNPDHLQVDERRKNCTEDVRAIRISDHEIPADLKVFLSPNSQTDGGTQNKEIRTSIDQFFIAKGAVSTNNRIEQAKKGSIVLGGSTESLAAEVCKSPKGNGNISFNSLKSNETPQKGKPGWLLVVQKNGNFHRYVRKTYLGQSADDKRFLWDWGSEGQPSENLYSVQFLGMDRPSYTWAGKQTFSRGDIVQVINQANNQKKLAGYVEGITTSHVIIDFFDQYSKRIDAETPLQYQTSRFAVKWQDPAHKLEKVDFTKLDAADRLAATGSCVIKCSWSSAEKAACNPVSKIVGAFNDVCGGKQTWKWELIDGCVKNRGYRCQLANRPGHVQIGKACEEVNRGYDTTRAPIDLGCAK